VIAGLYLAVGPCSTTSLVVHPSFPPGAFFCTLVVALGKVIVGVKKDRQAERGAKRAAVQVNGAAGWARRRGEEAGVSCHAVAASTRPGTRRAFHIGGTRIR